MRFWLSPAVSTRDKMSCLMTKPTKWHERPAKTQISLRIRPVWSESLLSAWRKLGSLATHWAHSEDSDQTGQMPRLIIVFAGCLVILLVLSWDGSNYRPKSFCSRAHNGVGVILRGMTKTPCYHLFITYSNLQLLNCFAESSVFIKKKRNFAMKGM